MWCVYVCVVYFRDFGCLGKSGVYWVILGGIRQFWGTLTVRGGGVSRQVMGGLGGF